MKRNKRLTGSAESQTLTRLIREIIDAKGRAALALYEMGVRLAQISDDELWRAGRFTSFEDFLARGVDVPASSAHRCMRFAEHFNREICARYGVNKLEAIIRYARVTLAKERAGDLLAAEIRLRDKGGRYATKALHDASAGEIQRAAALVADSKRGRRRIPTEVRERADRLAKLLPAAPRGLAAKNRARLTRGRDGRIALSLTAIPLDEIENLIEALKETLL